jgi:putative flippase GtrA
MRFISRDFLRFLLWGGINTFITFGIYAVLLKVVPYPVAYTIAYVSGIFTSYCLNTLRVFRKRLSLRRALQYPFVYLVQYLAGLLVLYVLIEMTHLNKLIASPIAVIMTTPLTFLLAGLVIKRDP